MTHPLFIFTAKKGEMNMPELSDIRFRQHLREHEGAVYEVHQRTKKRTLSQNSLYWKFLQYIEEATGNNAGDLHQFFRRKLLPPKFITVLGNEVKVPHSTTDLNSYEFRDYLDKISSLSGVAIPNTEEYKKWRDSAPLVGEEYPLNNKTNAQSKTRPQRQTILNHDPRA